MKILYFISINSHGRGGHLHSLNHISRKVGEQNEVKIISFGSGDSSIVKLNPYFEKHIIFNGLNFFYLKKEIENTIQQFTPDIYHCFDEGSYNIVRLIISSKKNKIVLNKCGGGNPVKFPHVTNLILFSQENMEWFKNQKKYENSIIHLIPNRVKKLLSDENFHPIIKKSDDFVFMRICRIGTAYKKSIQDSIQLIEKLKLAKIQNIKLYVIGAIEDNQLFDKLNQHPLVQSGNIIFLTESTYTSEASKMLYLADAVIGTGRSIMEAASLAKPILAINANGDIPVLLNDLNFQDAFKTNFSERNTFSDYKQNENLDSIIKMLSEKGFYRQISKFSKKTFKKYFDLDAVSKAYTEAYKQSITGKRNLLSDIVIIMKSILNFYLSYKKLKIITTFKGLVN